MSYIGDFALGSTFDTKFTTVDTTGAPTTLAGTPAISAYADNSTTEITAGITLTVDFDSRTGMHNVRVVATSGNGYASGSNYQLVITTGTVGGTSVVGYVVAEFSVEARSALRPTTAGRTLDVSATGESGVDWANVGSPTTTVGLTGTTISTSQVVASVSGAVGSVTGAVGSVTGNVGGNVAGSVASVTNPVSVLTGIKKNQALADFEFLMTDSTNHNPITGLTVAVTRSIDNGAFAAGTLSAVTEISNGIYSVDFGAGDLNGTVITLRATAVGADDLFVTIVPDP